MKKNMINEVHLEGLLYDHKLELKTSGAKSKNPGTSFITGTISIATDAECLNVVQVHFTYVTALTSKNQVNKTYTTLDGIVNGTVKSIMGNSKEEAAKLRIDTAIGLNEWYDKEDKLISAKRNEGGFVHTIDVFSDEEQVRNKFKADMLITGTTRIEADDERGLPEKLTIKGAIFDFRKSLLPVEFTAMNPAAMDYFEGLGASSAEPVFTTVWGKQISRTVTKTTTEESAFGEPSVNTTTSTIKEFMVTGAATETMAWDDESTILASELKKALTDRELMLAETKKRRDDYLAEKSAGAATAVTAGEYDF